MFNVWVLAPVLKDMMMEFLVIKLTTTTTTTTKPNDCRHGIRFNRESGITQLIPCHRRLVIVI